jgi:hypothetical protein
MSAALISAIGILIQMDKEMQNANPNERVDKYVVEFGPPQETKDDALFWAEIQSSQPVKIEMGAITDVLADVVLRRAKAHTVILQ